MSHLAAPRRRRFQSVSKGHNAGHNQRRILAQRMTHDHIRAKTKPFQQPVHGNIHRQHGRLGDFRLHQVEGGFIYGRAVVRVYKNIVGQRFAQNRRHHRIRLVKHGLHFRVNGRQFPPHVHILAALAGKKEGDLTRRPSRTAINALRLHRFPGR